MPFRSWLKKVKGRKAAQTRLPVQPKIHTASSHNNQSSTVSDETPYPRLSREIMEHLASSNSTMFRIPPTHPGLARPSRKRKFTDITQSAAESDNVLATPATIPSTLGDTDSIQIISDQTTSFLYKDQMNTGYRPIDNLPPRVDPPVFNISCLDRLFKFCCGAQYHQRRDFTYFESISQDSFEDDRFDHAADWLLQI
eukprot:Gregarina_sp_Poly_1__5027@NODE_2664_length_1854_cov_208_709010_g1690_i0_p2_GENE_NODE_2664_length_1854_cov_208_709010_g1690_i0NODE_2664_length_1854_cov_208_709010_g1690_i0_p2_ORF_typecomplete_len197_score22_69_NODE_2664_length_1854_cov_208_709010_g1690_i0387977